jgi:hypothetical protein
VTWFLAEGGLPPRPKPLEYTFGIQAFLYGLTHALESLRFPLYEVRGRLVDGQLYLGSVPSAMAESDLEMRMRALRDSVLRFSRNIRHSWDAEVREEVVGYNDRMEAFPPREAGAPEVADGLFALRRVRANQWFASVRAAVAPAALALASESDAVSGDVMGVVEDMRELVVERGAAAFDGAVDRVAARLVRARSLDAADDVSWLEYGEVQDALRTAGTRCQPVVAERRSAAERPPVDPSPAAVIGPTLADGAPRTYLLHEILALIEGRRP